jgi:hypothetical protein
MDDSMSEIVFGKSDERGFDGEHWEVTREGIAVHRVLGITNFPWDTVKSYTMVYPEWPDELVTEWEEATHYHPRLTVGAVSHMHDGLPAHKHDAHPPHGVEPFRAWRGTSDSGTMCCPKPLPPHNPSPGEQIIGGTP